MQARASDNFIKCAGFDWGSGQYVIRIINDNCGWASRKLRSPDDFAITGNNNSANWSGTYSCGPIVLWWSVVSWATWYWVYYDGEYIEDTASNNYTTSFTPSVWRHYITIKVVWGANEWKEWTIFFYTESCPTEIVIDTTAATSVTTTTATLWWIITLYWRTMSQKWFVTYVSGNPTYQIGTAWVTQHVKTPLWVAWSYTLWITWLTSWTQYKYRWYALDSVSWLYTYGDEVSFTTL